MVVPSNRHVQKYNQMVDVYDPTGVERIPKLQGEDQGALERHRDVIERRRATVESLAVEDILSASERADIEANDSLPEPAAVAEEKREDMLERLDLAVEVLDDQLEQQVALDTAEFDGFDDAVSSGADR